MIDHHPIIDQCSNYPIAKIEVVMNIGRTCLFASTIYFAFLKMPNSNLTNKIAHISILLIFFLSKYVANCYLSTKLCIECRLKPYRATGREKKSRKSVVE